MVGMKDRERKELRREGREGKKSKKQKKKCTRQERRHGTAPSIEGYIGESVPAKWGGTRKARQGRERALV
jgi:hypothetical protein